MMNHFILPTFYLLLPFVVAMLFVGFIEIFEDVCDKWNKLRSKFAVNFEVLFLKSIIYLVWSVAFILIGVALYLWLC